MKQFSTMKQAAYIFGLAVFILLLICMFLPQHRDTGDLVPTRDSVEMHDVDTFRNASQTTYKIR